jgi:hypothetical protein
MQFTERAMTHSFCGIGKQLAPVILFATLAACSGDHGGVPARSITDSAGVTILAYGGSDAIESHAPNLLTTIGGRESGPESFTRLTEALVAADGAGRINILDAQSYSVSIIRWREKTSRSIGHRGDGPGELSFPTGITSRPDSGFAVIDFAKGGLSHFTPDGEFIQLQGVRGLTPSDRVKLVRSGIVFTTSELVAGGDSVRRALRLQTGDSSSPLAFLTRVRSAPIEFTGCPIARVSEPFFAPPMHWDARGGRVVIATPDEYELRVFDAERLTMIIRKETVPRPATDKLARAELGDSLRLRSGAQRCNIPASEAVAKIGVAELIPPIHKVRIDPEGFIWVQRGKIRGETSVIDIFDGGGQYVSTMRTEVPFPVDFLPGGEVIVLGTDSTTGVDVVLVYGGPRRRIGSH